MANPEHLEILKQGVEVWNRWREENSQIRPDLSRADLDDIYLHGANLSGSDLARAYFRFGKLWAVDFRKANLTEAFLVTATLRGADLGGAILDRANFSGADLREVDLSGALLFRTIFADTDLTGANGLELCRHSGLSIIDHRTLARSGLLPLKFLRGCGLPDKLIDYLPSLLEEPIQFYSCFISYSSKDQDFAERLHADLQNNGVRCWFAPEDMKIGDRIRPRIDEVIRVHDKLLLVLSENSITSEWVEKEVETAFEKERERKTTVLFPIRLDDAVMDSKLGWAADIKRSRHIGDFTRWKEQDAYQKAFERLLRDLRAETTTKSTP